MMTDKQHRRSAGGFTLIELMIVIGILSLLMVALQPAISSAFGRSEAAETRARMLLLDTAIKSFDEEYGYFPPDDFQERGSELGVTVPRDPVNTGIESLVVFLSWSANGGTDLTENEKWLGNTDADESEVLIPLLERTAKVEVLDAWGSPIVYFHNRGYAQSQTVRLASGDDVKVKAINNPNSQGYLSPRKFQLISAGEDGAFGTEDDLTHPELPPPN